MKINETFQNNFAKTLRKLLKINKKTSRELAKYLNLTPQAISNYLAGKNEPNIFLLSKIAEFFNISIDELLTCKKPENKPIREILGLSEKAIENLKDIKNNKDLIILNDILENENLKKTLDDVQECFLEIVAAYSTAGNALGRMTEKECEFMIKITKKLYLAKSAKLLTNFFEDTLLNSFAQVFSLQNEIWSYVKNKKVQKISEDLNEKHL